MIFSKYASGSGACNYSATWIFFVDGSERVFVGFRHMSQTSLLRKITSPLILVALIAERKIIHGLGGLELARNEVPPVAFGGSLSRFCRGERKKTVVKSHASGRYMIVSMCRRVPLTVSWCHSPKKSNKKRNHQHLISPISKTPRWGSRSKGPPENRCTTKPEAETTIFVSTGTTPRPQATGPVFYERIGL